MGSLMPMRSSKPALWRSRLDRLARIGVLPTDSREEALRKETLVLSAAVITFLSVGGNLLGARPVLVSGHPVRLPGRLRHQSVAVRADEAVSVLPGLRA